MTSGMSFGPVNRSASFSRSSHTLEEGKLCEECCPQAEDEKIQPRETVPDPHSADWETEQPPYYHRDIF
jgi:hypothetical protein